MRLKPYCSISHFISLNSIFWTHSRMGFFINFFKKFLFEREREKEKEQMGRRWESEADSLLTTQPNVGLHSTTVRSWPEQKLKVRAQPAELPRCPLLTFRIPLPRGYYLISSIRVSLSSSESSPRTWVWAIPYSKHFINVQ